MNQEDGFGLLFTRNGSPEIGPKAAICSQVLPMTARRAWIVTCEQTPRLFVGPVSVHGAAREDGREGSSVPEVTDLRNMEEREIGDGRQADVILPKA